MKKTAASLLVCSLLCSLLLCGCGKEEELGAWEMPQVDTRPTPVPTAAPSYGASGTAESYLWNEAVYFKMSDPGTSGVCEEKTLTHNQCAALFPYNFLPASIFGESHAKYGKLTLKKQNHDVVTVPEDSCLAEHAYVEYVYAPKNGKEGGCLTVMAELCGYDAAEGIYSSRIYPHAALADGAKPQLSRYYFRDFVLYRYGEQRVAQILKLTPTSYFTDAKATMDEAEEQGEVYTPQRQILLTVTCGDDMTDEEFIAAVSILMQFSDGSEKPAVEGPKLPGKGEKGAA